MHSAKRNKRITSWHLIGAQLATFRKAARMTQTALADQCCVGEDTIASIEQGRRPLQADFAAQLDELLGTKGVLQVAVSKVPKKERFPAFVQDFVKYEREAVTLLWYENQVVPGLLQTEEYIRFVFSCLYPPLEVDEQEEWVAGRLDRQRLLERKPRRGLRGSRRPHGCEVVGTSATCVCSPSGNWSWYLPCCCGTGRRWHWSARLRMPSWSWGCLCSPRDSL
ncbi:Scr1 family TA system antitoxin-like transcriptional regulator [Streptomyces sp. NPDC018000]|uniref:Scr1 family TA system antitoxin-like transcriptional regulator n=1 Tax=Streptomyces sp. NPDC018000 TaxID=3365028 RepID=UPI0037AA57B8